MNESGALKKETIEQWKHEAKKWKKHYYEMKKKYMALLLQRREPEDEDM